ARTAGEIVRIGASAWIGLGLLAACGRAPGRQSPAPKDGEVSVGYGTESTQQVTGAIASLSPGETDARVTQVVQMLERMSGLTVIQIGRASCRERVYSSVCALALREDTDRSHRDRE